MRQIEQVAIAPENPTEAGLIESARSKIRNWAEDLKLKFHFSSMVNMDSILSQGILSHKFAERIGQDIDKDLGAVDGTSISISDRLKSLSEPSRRDWWLKQFAGGNPTMSEYVGFVLDSDLPVRDQKAHHHNESYASIRVRPERIQGLVVADNPELEHKFCLDEIDPEASGSPWAEYYASKLFGKEDFFPEGNEELKQLKDRSRKLWSDMRAKNLPLSQWPTESKIERQQINFQINKLNNEEAIKYLEGILGKKREDIRKVDFFIYYAEKYGLPLYKLDKNLKSTVIWPNGNDSASADSRKE
jgi:hypothetical protein